MNDDTISRRAAIEEFEEWANHIAYAVGEDYSGVQLLALAISKIKRMPSAQPESHREWYMKGYRDAQRWIPVAERQPNHELAIVQYSDGDFDLLQFPTAYRRKDIVAWMPLPEPWRGGQDETN